MSRARLTPRPRPAEELQQELINKLGWHAAIALIHREAENLRVSPESSTAIRSAYATYSTNRNNRPTETEQEPML